MKINMQVTRLAAWHRIVRQKTKCISTRMHMTSVIHPLTTDSLSPTRSGPSGRSVLTVWDQKCPFKANYIPDKELTV